ncbi:uncharacterized protein LOC111212345 [Brassica napus]|uniref:uncharacterized protein LOC111212345 n=1 Tax=Brassica napus TaxID=3708 RepID=UPI00207A2C42|nr:uncharacterized protein LOC111212345 [Brassica napus]XP_048621448.1 uncharacterized protein LOC111212345 [Brassica napus]XP_048621449.1 uncharacterized protein LOC111212345 [Brassica napus]
MEGEIDEECNGQFTCEEDKHVTDIASEVKEVNEETIIVKECQSSVDQMKEEVDNSLDSPKLEIVEEVALMEEKPEEVLQIGEKVLSNETPMTEMEIEKPSKLTKKDVNVVINRTRNSPMPDQVRTKQTTNKIATTLQENMGILMAEIVGNSSE